MLNVEPNPFRGFFWGGQPEKALLLPEKAATTKRKKLSKRRAIERKRPCQNFIFLHSDDFYLRLNPPPSFFVLFCFVELPFFFLFFFFLNEITISIPPNPNCLTRLLPCLIPVILFSFFFEGGGKKKEKPPTT